MAAAPDLKGLVLAGGRSSRLGADKAAVEVAGEHLLDKAVSILATVLADVYVSVRPDQSEEAVRVQHRLIEDQFSDIGPAAGILAAHTYSPDSAWLVTACDMPLLDVQTIATLVAGRRADCEGTVMVTAVDANAEPLCAIYEPVTLAAFHALVLAGGNSSPRAWLQGAHVERLVVDSIDALYNVNTADELERVNKLVEGRSSSSDGSTDG